jgi:AcrR family transcriptional regulator
MTRVTQAHIEARTGDIKRAAHAVFARKGFDRATMQDIAGEAGISAGAIYRYFPSKEAIIAAMFAETMTLDRAMLDRMLAEHGDTIGIIHALADSYFARLAGDDVAAGACLDLELWAEAPRNPAVQDPMRESFAQLISAFARLIREGQARGELRRDVDPESIAYLMVATFDGLIVHLALGHKVDIDEYTRTVKTILGDGLRAAR